MSDFLAQIWAEREWVFGGFGVAAVSAIVWAFRHVFLRHRQARSAALTQSQKGGAFSRNMQIGSVDASREQ